MHKSKLSSSGKQRSARPSSYHFPEAVVVLVHIYVSFSSYLDLISSSEGSKWPWINLPKKLELKQNNDEVIKTNKVPGTSTVFSGSGLHNFLSRKKTVGKFN